MCAVAQAVCDGVPADHPNPRFSRGTVGVQDEARRRGVWYDGDWRDRLYWSNACLGWRAPVE